MLGRQKGVRIDFLDVTEVLEDPCTGGSNSGFLDKILWQDLLQNYRVDFSVTHTHYRCMSEVVHIVFR